MTSLLTIEPETCHQTLAVPLAPVPWPRFPAVSTLRLQRCEAVRLASSPSRPHRRPACVSSAAPPTSLVSTTESRPAAPPPVPLSHPLRARGTRAPHRVPPQSRIPNPEPRYQHCGQCDPTSTLAVPWPPAPVPWPRPFSAFFRRLAESCRSFADPISSHNPLCVSHSSKSARLSAENRVFSFFGKFRQTRPPALPPFPLVKGAQR